MLAAIIHTLDPFAIDFGNGFGIRWYGLAYAGGFLIGWFVLRSLARKGRIALSTTQVADLMTYLIAGVIIGGRVGHVLFYEPQLLVTFHGEIPWWGLLDIHKGGMSSHGGILGTIVASWLFAKRQHLGALHMIDCVAFAAPFGLSFGRLANFVNGELPGRPLPESMQANPPWWSIKYPDEVYSAAFDVDRLQPLAGLVNPNVSLPQAVRDAAYLHRADVLAKLEPLLTAYYPSNFIQAITDGPILFAAMALVWLRPRKPGAIAATFLIAYGALRVASEQFREIDSGVFMLGPVTLPMMLSLGMVAIGITLAAWASRQSAPAIGGLVQK